MVWLFLCEEVVKIEDYLGAEVGKSQCLEFFVHAFGLTGQCGEPGAKGF